jgi:hypothetical protein
VVENVELLIGHVEFQLFFMVLDSNLPCCILGLDQMRRFKCQVDLDDNVLVFGGKGGVSVPFLEKEEASALAQHMIAAASITEQASRNQSSSTSSKKKSLFNWAK